MPSCYRPSQPRGEGNCKGALGQPVVIENKPGANGNIGAMEVLRSPVDGHKLLIANGVMTLIPHTVSTPMADPLQFTPLGLMLQSALVLCVNPKLPAKNLAEFTAYVKEQEKPGAASPRSSA